MGTLVATYSEQERKFFSVARKVELNVEGVRQVLTTPYRYCLGDNYFYVPNEQDRSLKDARLCWARIREFPDDIPDLMNATIEFSDLEGLDIRIGNQYVKRQKEVDGKFVPVDLFCSEELLQALENNPEALPAVSHDEFEALCAELFVRRGFKVDLFRSSGDGGIDFLALQDERVDPIIFAVQCKQPQDRPGKKRKSLGRPVLQQIYGAAKAWDLTGAIAISGSTYSPQAKRFADLKPGEMEIYRDTDILDWIKKYRWNEDE